jgi:hypothetical protein
LPDERAAIRRLRVGGSLVEPIGESTLRQRLLQAIVEAHHRLAIDDTGHTHALACDRFD